MTQLLLRHRRWCVELVQICTVALALAASFWLRFEFTLDPPYPRMLLASLPLAIAAKLIVYRLFGLRDLAWRYFGFQDLVRLAGANVAASAAATLVIRPVIGSLFPRSIHIIDLLIATALLLAAHAFAKILFGARARRGGIRTAIYGAGRAGVTLLDEIRSGSHATFEIRGFFDDDPVKRDLRIHGVRVLGGLKALGQAVRKQRIEMLLIALPDAGGDTLAAIVEECRRAQVRVQRVLPAAELSGGRSTRRIRDLRLEDLLGRRPVELDSRRVASGLAGRVALITGAGGSIGSELCRHIARFRPAALVGLDHSENALFEIDREMRAHFPDVPFHPEIGNIRDARRLDHIFRQHAPDSVYHAAAYKHVPMMEAHLFEAVQNNVFGTRNVLRAATDAGAGEFVLISSDKAVRPANVMGATKRLAEMIVQAHRTPRAMAVRFGNVLGSSGSVVPLFQRQIAAGGPLRITHPEMTRFFMTIPEAVQLVVEAAAMGRGAEIFVLDMGEPVRIVELARKMILLSGLSPEEVPIEFTGVRPGEKLHEELSAYEEDTVATTHPHIRIFGGRETPGDALHASLKTLRAAIDEEDAGGVVLCLTQLVPGYNPSEFLIERAFPERARSVFA